MAASNYKPSLALVLAHEGGYVNHPSDPGGATNRGVTQAVYDAFRRFTGAKIQSVRNISPLEVTEIYNKQYWKLVRGDSLPTGLDYAVFDFAVNSGVSRATRYLQRLVGVEDDGVLGMITLTAVEAAMRLNEEAVISQYCANRMAFVRSLKTFKTFGVGWTRRIIGYQAGVQREDTGVIDYAVFMCKRDLTYSMPTEVGSLPGETAGKAVAPLAADTFVEAPVTRTVRELKGTITEINDQLAVMIEAS